MKDTKTAAGRRPARKQKVTEDQPVSREAALFRLCRIICSLMEREKDLRTFLRGHDADFNETSELQDLLLDLCGVPAEENACRDLWSDALDLLTPEATEKDFRRLLGQIEELKGVESIHYGPGGVVEKVVYRN